MTNLQQQRAQLERLLDNQIDPSSGLAISCQNCIYCQRDSFGVEFNKCMKCGGAYCTVVHMFPNVFGHNCHNYSAWSPRQKSILELIGDKIRRMLTNT